MPQTIIHRGQIRRRTKRMSVRRAEAFAKALKSNPRGYVTDISIIFAGRNAACVEFTPARAQTILDLFNEQQSMREQRADDVRTNYKFRRVRHGVWQCTKPDGTIYEQRLHQPSCSCPDWDRINSVGGKCKHFIVAEIAEQRYQAHILERSVGDAS